jgi:hypothetical protein
MLRQAQHDLYFNFVMGRNEESSSPCKFATPLVQKILPVFGASVVRTVAGMLTCAGPNVCIKKYSLIDNPAIRLHSEEGTS